MEREVILPDGHFFTRLHLFAGDLSDLYDFIVVFASMVDVQLVYPAVRPQLRQFQANWLEVLKAARNKVYATSISHRILLPCTAGEREQAVLSEVLSI